MIDIISSRCTFDPTSLDIESGLELVVQPSDGGDSTSKDERKICCNIFLSGAWFSRKSSLKFVHLCEQFSCLF